MYSGSLGTISNRETWEQAIDVVDENGDNVTITGATIVLSIRRQGEKTPTLTVSTGSGIVIATPRFTFTFSVTDMRSLNAGNYEVGCTILLNGLTTQLIVGNATIVDGIVS